MNTAKIIKAAHAILFTMKSRNAKVGPIPVSTTSRDSCSATCPLYDVGCYALAGPLGIIWRNLSRAIPGHSFQNGKANMQSLTWNQFCRTVSELAVNTLWRHNQAGDLPGNGDSIDAAALRKLTKANRGKRGFTYTHKPLIGPYGNANRAAIAAANNDGFVVNLSADNLSEADSFVAMNIAPVVVILPSETGRKVKGDNWLESLEAYRARMAVYAPDGIKTPDGHNVAVCPATYLDTSCHDCKLCARPERKCLVGFPGHGVSKNAVSAIALAS